MILDNIHVHCKDGVVNVTQLVLVCTYFNMMITNNQIFNTVVLLSRKLPSITNGRKTGTPHCKLSF